MSGRFGLPKLPLQFVGNILKYEIIAIVDNLFVGCMSHRVGTD
jgi:hypothetical protein